ncbi:putative ubiquitin-2 like Rad60 SUMO-like [Lyophyllum shimeji]|uniref:Ubiquitin-2 like Rad60 SUMO-like n=1 Tax=Lyophyllum shimeji TaxID=47721 RepID=A0A9P3PNB7_LYOSH|nr:putative ubiquitin-2 like Rad60 SUMO-like [Lyophyllum shimeji]
MASLEPPTRPYVATEGPSSADVPSARTSATHLEMTEAETSPRIVGARPAGSTSHEPPLSPPTNDDAASRAEEKDTVAGESAGASPAVPQSPQVYITFLVISGRRRTMSFEPETTLGRLKELVWNAWPAEWEDERPVAPAYLRVLYLGKMLQDDDTLSKLKFPTYTPQSGSTPTPTIVHLSVRPGTETGRPMEMHSRPEMAENSQEGRDAVAASSANIAPPVAPRLLHRSSFIYFPFKLPSARASRVVTYSYTHGTMFSFLLPLVYSSGAHVPWSRITLLIYST